MDQIKPFDIDDYVVDVNSWKLPPKSELIAFTFGCARGPKDKPSIAKPETKPRDSKKIDCPFLLKGYIDEQRQVVYLIEENGHNHDIERADSRRWLELDEDVTIEIEKLLLAGLSPGKVLDALYTEHFHGIHDEETVLSKARREVTKADVKRIARRLLNHTKLHQNDIIGTELLINKLDEQESLLFYQKQLVQTSHNTVEVTQPFQLGIMTPWGADMMKKLGKKIAFLDACHGMNQYGYPIIHYSGGT